MGRFASQSSVWLLALLASLLAGAVAWLSFGGEHSAEPRPFQVRSESEARKDAVSRPLEQLDERARDAARLDEPRTRAARTATNASESASSLALAATSKRRAGPGCRVLGTVRASDGRVLTGSTGDVLVTLKMADGQQAQVVLDGNGDYFLPGVPPGQAALHVISSYEQATKPVTVWAEDLEMRVDIQLDQSPVLLVRLDVSDPDAVWRLTLNSGGLWLFTTLEPIDSVLPADALSQRASNLGSRTPRSHFRCRTSSDESEPLRLMALVRASCEPTNPLDDSRYPSLPTDCVGLFVEESARTHYVHLCVGQYVLQSQLVSAGAQDATFRVTVQDLDRAAASVQLLVVDAITRKPLEAARATLRGATGEDGFAQPDVNGNLRFAVVRAGQLALSVTCAGYAPRQERITVSPGIVTNLGEWELNLETHVRGRVLDDEDKPIVAQLKLVPLNAIDAGRFVKTATATSTAETGAFELRGVGAGRYLLVATGTDLAAEPTSIDTLRGSIEDLVVRVRRATTTTITFAADLPYDALARIDAANGLPVFVAFLRDGRSYELQLLPGKYDARVLEAGATVATRRFEIGSEPSVILIQR